MTSARLLLVGCGKMGSAMLQGWRDQGLTDTAIVEPHGNVPGALPSPDSLPPGFTPAAVVFAVKPQEAPRIVPAYARFAPHAVFVSIMAGTSVAGLASLLGHPDARIVRAMPNTPAAIRRGITVACPGPTVTPADRALADQLLAAVGEVAWIKDEALLDPVTAVSGGGPAYVFLLVELLAAAAEAEGIEPALAMRLARVTVAGSGALLDASPDEAAVLRRNVTSPGGTTAEALKVLMAEDAWPASMHQAIRAATQRSRALAEAALDPGPSRTISPS